MCHDYIQSVMQKDELLYSQSHNSCVMTIDRASCEKMELLHSHGHSGSLVTIDRTSCKKMGLPLQ